MGEEILGILLIITGIIAYLHITRKERALRRARREKMRRHRKYVRRFQQNQDEIDDYFKHLRDNSKQKIVCRHPELLQAGEEAYREMERRAKKT